MAAQVRSGKSSKSGSISRRVRNEAGRVFGVMRALLCMTSF